MANPNMPMGRRFDGSKPGNPKGSSAKARMRAALKRMHKTLPPDEVSKLIGGILDAPPHEIEELAKNNDSSILLKLLASFIAKCFVKPDVAVLRCLLEYSAGPPKTRQTVEHTGRDGGPIEIESEAQIAARIAAVQAELKELGDG